MVHLGLTDYAETLELQHRVRAARQAGAIGDVLLLTEHPRVYTQGRRSTPEELAGRPADIPVVPVDRGGKLTYHGPGQCVGYPVMHTSDVLGFVRTMEEALVAALADAGVAARLRTEEGVAYTGVWVEGRKVASIGLHVSRGITTHGWAVNVTTDLEPFAQVIACGLPGVAMTSVAEEGGDAGERCFARRAAHRFAEAHGLKQRLVSRARLERSLEPVAAAGLS